MSIFALIQWVAVFFNVSRPLICSPGVRQRGPVGDTLLRGGRGLGRYISHMPEEQHHSVLVPGHRGGLQLDLSSAHLRPLLQHLQQLWRSHGYDGGTSVKAAEWRAIAGFTTSPTFPRMHSGGRCLCPERSSEDHLHAVCLWLHLVVLLPDFRTLQQRPAS